MVGENGANGRYVLELVESELNRPADNVTTRYLATEEVSASGKESATRHAVCG